MPFSQIIPLSLSHRVQKIVLYMCLFCCPADEWIRKLWYIYTMEYYLAIKKNTFEPLQYSCLENPMDRGAWKTSVHRVTGSNRTEVTEYTQV